jgi:phytoene dehydrogenase-like protein
MTARTLPSGVLDLDERLYLARYTAFDPSLAPSGEELIQIACGCRPRERSADVQARINALLDSLAPGWRAQIRWSRRSLLRAATGAVDPPGRAWADRPSIKQDDGIYCAGDYVAAPGLLAEVSFSSGREAGAAAAGVRREALGQVGSRWIAHFLPATARRVTSGTPADSSRKEGLGSTATVGGAVANRYA